MRGYDVHKMISTKDILAKFDQSAAEYAFPMIDNANYDNAAIRLTVFRNDDEWLVVFQEISFYPAMNEFADVITAFGNRLKQQGALSARPTVSLTDRPDSPPPDIHDFTVHVNGGPARRFTPSRDDYRSAHVDVDDRSRAKTKIIRYLASQIRRELFVDDDTLLKICERSSAGLQMFIELDEWHHPNLADDEPPSETPCFKSLAQALARGDAGLYKCEPARFNTGWWQWPPT